MPNLQFLSSNTHEVLEGLGEPSLELTLVHVGMEDCRPFHTSSDNREEYIIHFILDGAGFYSAHGSTWPLHSGQMFLIYPGEPIVYGSDRNDPWTYAWIGFKGIRAESILNQCGFSRSRLILPLADPPSVMDTIQDIMAHKGLNAADTLYREAGMLRLFSMLAAFHEQQTENESVSSATSHDLLYAKLGSEYIQNMYMHSEIGIDDIARHAGISRSRLNRAFQNGFHMSAKQYLIDFRLHHAADLLTSTVLPIKEISDLCGYNDQLVFSKAFKKSFGTSPKLYRDTHG